MIKVMLLVRLWQRWSINMRRGRVVEICGYMCVNDALVVCVCVKGGRGGIGEQHPITHAEKKVKCCLDHAVHPHMQ